MASQLRSAPEVLASDRSWPHLLSGQVPLLAVLTVVGLTLGGLLIGYQPVGDDPDLMYRPVKMELARALRSGTLPFWSDRFGLGIPLVAESHVAALYPLNWIFYGLLDVETAYRWLMWLHYVALAGTTYLLARDYTISPWGAAISSVSFTLCGFMAAHACHEPFYCVLPYLPLALWLMRRYLATGERAYQAALALSIGVQITLGHFQIQLWTIGLVILFGLAGILGRRAPLPRLFGLLLSVGWGLAAAAAQLALTEELAQYVNIQRTGDGLLEYGLPPAHLIQPVLPALFFGNSWKPWVERNYWNLLRTSTGEACWYVGTIPLILAVIGVSLPRRPDFRLWKLLILVCLSLACLPISQSEAYLFVVRIPVLGLFRAAARYTLIASLALSLLAGLAVDQTLSMRQLRQILSLAAVLGLVAIAWGAHWSRLPAVAPCLSRAFTYWSIVAAAVGWLAGLGLVALWARGSTGLPVLFLVTSIELAILFHLAPVRWDWHEHLDLTSSPIIAKLSSDPDVGLVAGIEANNLTAQVGITPANPYLGFRAPPPSYILVFSGLREPKSNPQYARWGRRFGVTHGVYRQWSKPVPGTEIAMISADPVLNRLTFEKFAMLRPGTDIRWRLERYPGAFPPVRVLLRARVVEDWPALFESLSREDHRDEATYMRADSPRQGQSPRASRAHLLSWNGTEAVVEHDGTCDVVFRRGWYPGWFFRTNDGPEHPVYRADGGLQAVRLYGSGPSKIHFRYRSPWWLISSPISLGASAGAIIVLLKELRRKWPPKLVQQNL